MNSVASGVSAASLKRTSFNDVDQFKTAVAKYRAHFTPLVRSISIDRTILNLPGVEIVLGRIFPRLADFEVAPDCTTIAFSMDDRPQVRVNGQELDQSAIMLAHGGSVFATRVETSPEFVTIVFTPGVRDRGWPNQCGAMLVPTMGPTLQVLRTLVPEILKFASDSPDALELPDTVAGIKESLFAALDAIFSRADLASIHLAPRHFMVIQRMEAIVAENLATPIYTRDLAETLGVSIRTLQDIVLRYRGMSLHRYLRLKRLWGVRRRLLAGSASIKVCALAHGFWHFSGFSKDYQEQFGEAPSSTVARARRFN